MLFLKNDQKIVPALLRSELVSLCNILIYCPDLCIFRCFKCLSFISSLQPIRYYIICHFFPKCNVTLHMIHPFFKVKFGLEVEVGDSNIGGGGGGFRLLFPTSCITVPLDCPNSDKNI